MIAVIMSVLFSSARLKQLRFWTALCGLVLFLFAVGAPFAAHAQPTVLQNLEAAGGSAGLSTQSIYALAGKIIRVVLGTLGFIAIGITIYAGFLWMTARGKEEQVDKAKDILRNGIIGLIIVLSAYGITEFIMSKLLNATTGGGEITDSGNGGAGADLANYTGFSQLGKVVESHDPGRDEKNVTRNKNIQVVFKFPVDLESVIDVNGSGVVKKNNIIIAGHLKTDNVSIYPTKEGKTKAFKAEEVIVFPINNNGIRGFVFDVQPVFEPNISYSVELGVGIQKAKPNTASVFSGFSGGYLWKFETGSDLDNIPPRIISVIPTAGGIYDRNITIQLAFSESVNMASSLGDYDPASKDKDGNPDKTFVNISTRAGDNADTIIKGSWRKGAGFNVIEFSPFEVCGKNSCGMDMFCLPAKSVLTVRALAGLLKNKGVSPEANILSGYQGVVDSANNALDGGGANGATPWSTIAGGIPRGSSVDDFFMKFSTTDKTKLTGPEIMSVTPAYAANSKSETPMNAASPVSITFDSLMKSSTFGDVELRAKNSLAQAGFWMESANKNIQNKDVTVLTIKHVDFAKKQDYGAIAPSSVLDIYQNCFLPAAGPGCSAAGQTQNIPAKLYCCNGTMSASPCPEQTYGQTKK